MLNDAHCHFFSDQLFASLARQRGGTQSVQQLCRELQWDEPGAPEALADRWVAELDRHEVARAAIIASVPADETSVATAVRRHPSRFVGFFMLDPSSRDAVEQARRAVTELALRTVCLFPAMHHVGLDDHRILRIVELVAEHPGTAVFVHCGVLSVGVRRKLGLPSRFDLRLGDPVAVAQLAMAFPTVPFIVPHFGAGLLRETLMAADLCPNIHLDTSSSNSWIRYTPGLTLESVLRSVLSVVGPSRVLFGTDSSFFPRGWQKPVFEAQKTAFASVGMSRADEALVLGGNFDRLFPAGV
jgi:predicted TIM-barrel fold metal-dependent hydrolase